MAIPILDDKLRGVRRKTRLSACDQVILTRRHSRRKYNTNKYRIDSQYYAITQANPFENSL